jgi:hypothetical protein
MLLHTGVVFLKQNHEKAACFYMALRCHALYKH